MKTHDSQFLVICRHTGKEYSNDGYRLSYDTFDEAYRKFLHTLWYYMSMKHNEEIICAMYQNYRIVYNFTMTPEKNELVDCLDGSKSKFNLTIDDLSKMILTAIMQYEAMAHDSDEKGA